jgi:hypothetical protein
MTMDISQTSFINGETSPMMEGRTNIEQYFTSCRTLRNMFVHQQGPVSNRAGTYYTNTVKTSANKIILRPFKFGTSQNYAIEFGDLYARFFKDGGIITVTADNVLDFNPMASYAIDWNLKVGNYLINTYATTKKLSFALPYGLADSGTIKIATQANTADSLSVTAATDTITIKFATTTASKNSALLIQNAIRAIAGGVVNGVDITKFTVTANAAYAAAPVLSGTITATLLANGDKLYKSILASPNAANNANFFPPLETTYWSELASGAAEEISTPYTEADLPYINYVQSADTMFIACRGYQPRILVRYSHYNWTISLYEFKNGPFMAVNTSAITIASTATTGNVTLTASSAIFDAGHVGSWWRIGAAVSGVFGVVQITAVTDSTHATATVKRTLSGTAATTTWAEGAWSDYRGWPSCVCFYADRIGFAGSESEPQAQWWSVSGDYTDYSRSSPLNDADGITLNLNSRAVHKIESISNLGDILPLTDEGVWWSGPVNSGGSFTPTTAKHKFQMLGGSSSINPVIIDNQAIFVQKSNNGLRVVEWNENSGGYVGGPVTYFSGHLFADHTIVEMEFQSEPEPIIWMIRDDGVLLGCTYNAAQKVIAFHHHETDGQFESICILPGAQYDEIWFVVKRGDTRFIERMANRSMTADLYDQYFVDCGLTLDSPVNITKVSIASITVITAAGHGLTDGDKVDISDIEWIPEIDFLGNKTQPDQLNKKQYTVANATTDTLTLKDEDGNDVNSLAFLAYVSGGKLRKAVTTIAGLDHLEGKSVAILANGAVYSGKTVMDGTITLDTPASRVHVGLPYVSDLETLNIEAVTDQGTLQSKEVMVTGVTLKLYAHGGGLVGYDNIHLTEINTRSNEPLGTPTALFTGDYDAEMSSGFKRSNRIYIRQSDPLPITILSIISRIEVGG